MKSKAKGISSLKIAQIFQHNFCFATTKNEKKYPE